MMSETAERPRGNRLTWNRGGGGARCGRTAGSSYDKKFGKQFFFLLFPPLSVSLSLFLVIFALPESTMDC